MLYRASDLEGFFGKNQTKYFNIILMELLSLRFTDPAKHFPVLFLGCHLDNFFKGIVHEIQSVTCRL